MDDRREAERVFDVVPIENACQASKGSCGKPVTSVAALFQPEVGHRFVWLCETHADGVAGMVDDAGAPFHDLFPVTDLTERVCGIEVDGVPCGAMATHVALVGYREGDRPVFGITNVCDRHAEEMREEVPR